jgi:RND superfamily putative drug exporter
LLRHPRTVLALAALVVAILAALGTGVEGRLSPTSLEIAGTPSERGTELLRSHFGDSAPFAILLQGPSGEIERQGPELVRALKRADPRLTTLSPWDRGAVGPLRPGPRRALIIADFHVDLAAAVNHSVDRLNAILDREVRAPVRATQTSYATLSRQIQDRSIDAAERSELIALPILLVVLLLVFRSPLAAAIPLLFGVATVAASRGLLYLVAGSFEVDAFALTVCTMMGLALGVDYALLMVSRFREELADGIEPGRAAARTRRTAGRTTVFAGSTLLLSMLVAFFIVPGSLLASLAATVALVVVLSVAIATIAGPAVLALLGPNVDRWRLGLAPAADGGLMAFVGAALRRPLAATVLIGSVVGVLAAPALGLETGPPSPSQLPEDDPARQDSERIARSVGAGFESPYVLIAASRYGPITAPSRLAALSELQGRIASAPGVQAVVGPSRLAGAVAPVREQGEQLLRPSAQLAQTERLGDGLAQARGGVAQVRGGIAEAAQGAGLLATGSGRASEGAGLIARGLGRARGGTRRLLDALRQFNSGIERLTAAQEEVLLGSVQLKTGLHEAIPNLRRNALASSRAEQRSLNQVSQVTLPRLGGPAAQTEAELRATLAGMEAMTVGRSDAAYAATLESLRRALAAFSGSDPVSAQPYAAEYSGLPAELAALEASLAKEAERSERVTSFLVSGLGGLRQLSAGAARLNDGAQQILAADRRLGRESQRLVDGVAPIGAQILRLGEGATTLAAGLAELEDGTESLEESLAQGFSDSYPLEPGLRRARVSVLASGERLRRGAGRLRRGSPGIFDSGYFVLSALDGAPPALRERASEAVDIERSGQAATLLVFSRYALNTPASVDFQAELESEAVALARKTGLRAEVAGGPAVLNDYSAVTRERIPIVVAAITIATFLILIAILRAIPLAALAVGLNLATVGVAFGILTLLTELPADVPLGGREYIDSVGATMIFGIVFGLSIDYAVFLLVRMRERYDGDGDHAAAITYGLEKTATVITGAAAIMLAVFIVFGGASIATVSQLGIGLTVAVFLDATVVRIVLLPALMILIGERVWWLPRWLDRALPRLSV